MDINKIIELSVGADLSALGGFTDIPIKKFIYIIGPRWISAIQMKK